MSVHRRDYGDFASFCEEFSVRIVLEGAWHTQSRLGNAICKGAVQQADQCKLVAMPTHDLFHRLSVADTLTPSNRSLLSEALSFCN